MDELLKKKRVTKGKVTRLLKRFDSLTPADAKLQFALHEKDVYLLTDEVNEVFGDILCETDEDKFEEYQLEFYETLDKLDMMKVHLHTLKSAEVSTMEQARFGMVAESVKLPRIELPTFAGDLSSWISFHDLFSATVHNNNGLSKAQKLQYLKSSLKGEAAMLLQAMTIQDSNYEKAWEMLRNRFQNKPVLITHFLDRLFNHSTQQSESSTALRRLADISTECVESLKVLEQPVEHWDTLLVYILKKKLDAGTLREWELLEPPDLPDIKDTFKIFKKFLEKRACALDALGIKKTRQVPNRACNAQGRKGVSEYVTHFGETENCVLCKEGHRIHKCQQFLEKTLPQRKEYVQRNRLCTNCLRKGHFKASCKIRLRCIHCNGMHHSLLHEANVSQPATVQEVVEARNSSQAPVVAHVSGRNTDTQTVLPTALVKALDRNQEPQSCRLLMYCGSQKTLISQDCAQRLGLPQRKSKIQLSGISSKDVGSCHKSVTLKIFGSNCTEPVLTVEAHILRKLTSWLPQEEIRKNQILQEFSRHQLADPNFDRPGKIDILLGANCWPDVILADRRVTPDGNLVAIGTIFGWVVLGRTFAECLEDQAAPITVHCVLDNTLTKFWELEDFPERKFRTQEEEDCEAHFLANVARDKTGRYVVRLPFKEETAVLGNSRTAALKRLHQIEKRFEEQSQWQTYKNFMNEYLLLGHMEKIPAKEVSKPAQNVYYIPHHAISAKKFRVVFDASMKSTSGISLNDKLKVGETIQDPIAHILLRFRFHQVVLVADLAKMYRQVKVHPSDTDFQRILWRNSRTEVVQEFRLLTLTYGTASAAFLATRCLQQLAEDEEKNFPDASKVLKRDFYVDDLLSGERSIEKALELQGNLIELLKGGGFELRKWASNKTEILEAVPPDDRETNLLLSILKDDYLKALGMQWHPASDTFSFNISFKSFQKEMTKRELLSEISKIFDPLGLLSPITVRAKILMQKLWKDQLEWDDAIPTKLQDEWLIYYNDLCHIQSLRIPRGVFHSTTETEVEIHAFCDASEKAYACTIYVGSRNLTGIKVQLLLSKTKVAPLKTISLPRLELCGAALLAKTVSSVYKLALFKIASLHCWTDSTIVLAWVGSHPSKWKTFVANRVGKIQTMIPTAVWHHVESQWNPADCASRGVIAEFLINHDLYWFGPEFILQNPIEYKDLDIQNLDVILETETKLATLHTVDTVNNCDFDLLDKFSCLDKLIRTTAYCLRFINNARLQNAERSIDNLSIAELSAATKIWVKIVQKQEFYDELESLHKNVPVKKRSKILKLNPFLDKDGLIRVGGRLRNAELPYDQKFPLLLPKSSSLTKLIISNMHLCHFHAGPQLLLTLIQRKYWILAARDAIRRIVRNCATCIRHRAITAKQFMGDLPSARVQVSRAFKKCGVDYCGPFILRASKGRSRATFKGYVALFICFATKAVHIELVSDLTSEAFIAALKRFISRRGRCSDVYSDCATNFVGAVRILANFARQYAVNSYLGIQEIKWHFNPPNAPHMGGLWESNIKAVKFHLKRILGNVMLTFEEMYTLLVQIEASLNSRPLKPLSADPNDLQPLTPGHFLIGDALGSLPEPDLSNEVTNRLTRWQLLQKLHQQFWKRWRSEYLTNLQTRAKWLSKERNFQIGDLVIIKDNNLPPAKWRLARVLEVFPGSDNSVRVVSIKTADGTFKRPISKLCFLPSNY